MGASMTDYQISVIFQPTDGKARVTVTLTPNGEGDELCCIVDFPNVLETVTAGLSLMTTDLIAWHMTGEMPERLQANVGRGTN